jgi:paraquat-inducible protein B
VNTPPPAAAVVDVEPSGGGHEPVSAVAKRRHISAIWLVPLVAAGLVIYLGYNALVRRGPEITLRFQTAQGILAQQTVLKYKDVPIGTVEDVDLTPNHAGVVVQVRMQREAKFVLTDHARFWVVRPRFSLESLSGLETLVTGAYISVDPGAPGGKSKRAFVGLEDPPGVTSDEPGKMFELKAPRIGSLTDGAPVFYRDVTVGSLLSHDLGNGLGPVSLRVFVHAPYDKLVHADTIFWNASGISVNMGADGLHVELASIEALLTGGIAFETHVGGTPAPVPDNAPPFRLYASKASADAALFDQNTACVSYFQGSVQGLARGSIVQMFGVPIGAVTDVHLAKDPQGRHFVARVAFNLQPERAFAPSDYHVVSPGEVRELVAQGLRVVLDTSSLLTGEKVISLEYVPGSKAATVTEEGGALVLPSQAGGLDGIMRAASDIAAKLNRIPFEDIGKNLDDSLRAVAATAGSPDLRNAIASLSATMKDAHHLVHEADTDLTPALQRLPMIAGELQGAVEHARDALGSAGYGANSDVQRGLARMIDQVGDAARTIRLLADFLDHHPEALIEGRSKHAEGK